MNAKLAEARKNVEAAKAALVAADNALRVAEWDNELSEHVDGVKRLLRDVLGGFDGSSVSKLMEVRREPEGRFAYLYRVDSYSSPLLGSVASQAVEVRIKTWRPL